MYRKNRIAETIYKVTPVISGIAILIQFAFLMLQLIGEIDWPVRDIFIPLYIAIFTIIVSYLTFTYLDND